MILHAMTEDQLENEDLNCLSEVGLVSRLRDAIYQLNPQLIRADALHQLAEAIIEEVTA